MIFGQVIQTWYERRLRAELARGPVPRHIGLVMDGNRRWARQVGYSDPSIGHRHGAEHIATVLDWCVHVGVGQVTVFLASVDNLRKRAAPEMQGLMEIVETVVAGSLIERSERWRLHVAGDLDALPDHTRHALKLAVEQTRDRAAGFDLTVAIGYDGRSAENPGLVHDLRATAARLEQAGRHTTGRPFLRLGLQPHTDSQRRPEVRDRQRDEREPGDEGCAGNDGCQPRSLVDATEEGRDLAGLAERRHRLPLGLLGRKATPGPVSGSPSLRPDASP